jgi:hypothetical protein
MRKALTTRQAKNVHSARSGPTVIDGAASMAALEERGECAFPEWPEALWARPEWSDVSDGVGQWLVWPHRHFDRQAAIDL